ncbi:MAG: efflux RND transporter periplasmic adaptor subunit [Hydrogenophaga sp.]|nr:efflux RND transporter periplasmic adaptor subunit [Hydrogenophaga sp.]
MKYRIVWAGQLLLAASVGLSACGGAKGGGESAPANAEKASPATKPETGGKATDAKPGGGGAVPVSLATAEQKPFDVVLLASAALVPASMVDIRAQMSGVVRQVHVKEGQTVKAGQLLFTLDAQADQANLARMKAQLAKDQALLADAQRQLERAQDLLARNFVSRGAVDTAMANRDGLQATVKADQAAIDAARVNVSYSQVRAASSGRLGAVPVFVGSTVKVNDTSLGTIVQSDPMDVQFAIPQDRLPALLERMKKEPPKVEVELPGVKRTATGQVSFVDNAVDAATGTVRVKARLKNTDGLLWPGLIVKARIQVQHIDDAVVVPAQAILQSPRGTAVFAVRDGKAEIQPVKVLAYQDDQAAVSGLTAGEKVVVDGRQNVRPGSVVNEVKPAAPASAGKGSQP